MQCLFKENISQINAEERFLNLKSRFKFEFENLVFIHLLYLFAGTKNLMFRKAKNFAVSELFSLTCWQLTN
jgi:hypothetical protein